MSRPNIKRPLLSALPSEPNKPEIKRRILSTKEYRSIVIFIEGFNGLAIECEREMTSTEFTHIDPRTLRAILRAQYEKHMQMNEPYFERNKRRFLRSFEHLSKEGREPSVIVHLAVQENISPVAMARLIVRAKMGFNDKACVERVLRNPKLLRNGWISANVATCVANDNMDGPEIRNQRRNVVAAYEVKLKDKCHEAGILYTDGHQLQFLGHEKTPDLQMIVPIKYKGREVCWIASKLTFGDYVAHVQSVQHEFSTYIRLFGPGLVIYWLGYEVGVPESTAYASRLSVVADFPPIEDIEIAYAGDFPMPYSFDDFNNMNESDVMCGLGKGFAGMGL